MAAALRKNFLLACAADCAKIALFSPPLSDAGRQSCGEIFSNQGLECELALDQAVVREGHSVAARLLAVRVSVFVTADYTSQCRSARTS
jgi:hypothetical protein